MREKRLAPTILSRPGARWNKRNGAREGEEWKSGTWVEQGVTVGPQTESPVVWPMRAASERARYHLKSLAFFVIVANANCLLGVQSVSKLVEASLAYIYVYIKHGSSIRDRSFVEYNVQSVRMFLEYIWMVDSKEQNKYESWCTKMSVQVYLLYYVSSYEQLEFVLDEARWW